MIKKFFKKLFNKSKPIINLNPYRNKTLEKNLITFYTAYGNDYNKLSIKEKYILIKIIKSVINMLEIYEKKYNKPSLYILDTIAQTYMDNLKFEAELETMLEFKGNETLQ